MNGCNICFYGEGTKLSKDFQQNSSYHLDLGCVEIYTKGLFGLSRLRDCLIVPVSSHTEFC